MPGGSQLNWTAGLGPNHKNTTVKKAAKKAAASAKATTPARRLTITPELKVAIFRTAIYVQSSSRLSGIRREECICMAVDACGL